MYQGPMSFPVSIGGDTVIVFGPFDPGDEVSTVVLQVHSSGAGTPLMTIEIERRPGAVKVDSFGGGHPVTRGAISILTPVGFDSLIRIPVNVIFKQPESLAVFLRDQSAADTHIGLCSIVFRGGVRGKVMSAAGADGGSS